MEEHDLYPKLLRRKDASKYLKDIWGIQRQPATLAKLAVVVGGPNFHKAGHFPLYPVSELDIWARDLLGPILKSTSEIKETETSQ